MKIIDYLEHRGYKVLYDKDYRETIDLWWQWYQGYVKDVHDYYVRTTTTRRKKFKRYRLGMAKVVCEDYASLLLNEKVQIAADFKALPDVLEDNCFLERGNRLVEIAMALGTGAFVEYVDNGKPRIDYLKADMIFPMRWDGDTIIDCAFSSIVRDVYGMDTDATYLQIHTQNEKGLYIVENVFLDDDGKELPIPDGMVQFTTPSPVPLFQIVRPNAYNSIDPNTPMGMSVYGAAISQLEACDIVYDSYVNEFSLGKKRILVPQSMGQIALTAAGKVEPYFDTNDGVFHVYKQESDDKNIIKEIDFSLRIEQHDMGMQRMLDILSKKCGLGAKRYSFNGDGVSAKTATEIISENSDLYQSMKRNEKPLERAIIGMVRALSHLSGGGADIGVTVEFDDSIIEDENTTIQKNILLVGNGLQSKLHAVMDVYKIDEKEAKKRLEEIASEQTVSPGAVDLLLQGERA